jgi:hypothetical protein
MRNEWFAVQNVRTWRYEIVRLANDSLCEDDMDVFPRDFADGETADKAARNLNVYGTLKLAPWQQ